MTLAATKARMERDPQHWQIALMDFVDGFRRTRDLGLLQEPFALTDPRIDALLASTAERLCAESGIQPPSWIQNIPAAPEPWFVSGLENLKAIALVESPAHFRARKIFVLENFLQRA